MHNYNKYKTNKVRLSPFKEVSQSFIDEYSRVIDFNKLRDSSDSDPELAHDSLSDIDADLHESDEAPSRECLKVKEEPDLAVEFPLYSETHPPGGIPDHCECELLLPYVWYKRLRCLFLISKSKMVQSGMIRGYLGLYHERFLHLLSFPYTIHPFSDFYWMWEFLTTIIVSASLIYEPYQLAFDCLQFVKHPTTTFSLFVSIFLLLDMLLTFRLGFTNKSTIKVTLDPYLIKTNYMGCMFWYDLITRLPYDILMIGLMSPTQLLDKRELTAVRAVTLTVKIFRIQKVHNFITKLAVSLQLNTWSREISTHGIIALFCVHWGACLHWLLPDITHAYLSKPKQYSWVTQLDLWEQERWIQYINSFLRSLSNLLTLDGGDYIPREVEEILCTSFLIIVAQSIFTYFVSTFSSMIIEFQKEEQLFREMVSSVDEYLRFRKIPDWLRERVFAYYDKKYRGRPFSEGEILNSMSFTLKTQIQGHNFKRLVEKVYLFSDVPTAVMLNLVQRLSYDICVPGDVMMNRGVQTDCIYFIEDGYFRVISQYGKCVEILSHGDFFGEVALLCPDIPRSTTIICCTFAEVYKLTKKNYKECMHKFPEVAKKIAQVAMERINYEICNIEEEVFRSKGDEKWKKIAEYGHTTIQQFYKDVDTGLTPANYMPPEALQQIYLNIYGNTNKREEVPGESDSVSTTAAWSALGDWDFTRKSDGKRNSQNKK